MIRVFPFRANEIEAIACSGGVDSVVFLDFLSRVNKNLKVVHFNHGTEHGKEAEAFVRKLCEERNLQLIVGYATTTEKPKQDSWEEFWRNERYKFFHSLSLTIATGQHLDDVAETWMFGAIHGQPKLIPFRNKNVIRPFLTTSKDAIIRWWHKHDIKFIEDPSNKTMRYSRNRIRHLIIPQAIKVNPGLLTVMKKKLVERAKHEKSN